MVRRLGLGKNNHLTYASLALNPRYNLYNFFFFFFFLIHLSIHSFHNVSFCVVLSRYQRMWWSSEPVCLPLCEHLWFLQMYLSYGLQGGCWWLTLWRYCHFSYILRTVVPFSISPGKRSTSTKALLMDTHTFSRFCGDIKEVALLSGEKKTNIFWRKKIIFWRKAL